jgi:E3 ubiquitin-protein ligase HECTD2
MPRITQMEHKDLMIGDVYDVASSLVGNQLYGGPSTPKHQPVTSEASGTKLVNQLSPHIDWKYLQKWYEIVMSVGVPGKDARLTNLKGDDLADPPIPASSRKIHVLEELGSAIRSGMLELTEQLLIKQQVAPLEPQDIRYILILLANPLLTNSKEYPTRRTRKTRRYTLSSSNANTNANGSRPERQHSPPRKVPKWLWNPTRQSRSLSLIIGALSNLSPDCHNYLTAWFSRYPEDVFRKHVDTILCFVNERITLRKVSSSSPSRASKSLTHNGIQTSLMFDDVLNSNVIPVVETNIEDWQLVSACKVLQLFVRANDAFHPKSSSGRHSGGVLSNARRKSPTKQLIPTEHFYTSQLDSEDRFNLREDYDAWEKKQPGFHLCQYPFLLTLGTKIKILEFDAKRRMASKARQEFFDAILRQGGSAEKFFHLNIRRTCIIEDSLQRVSEAISSSQEEAKKALKVRFEGEEGVDAGGLRKEWFLLLVRELFDPDVGKFSSTKCLA